MKRIVFLTALFLLAIVGAEAHKSINKKNKPIRKKGTGIKAAANVQDSLALVAFYNSTDGPNWTNNTNWLTGEVETWYGVTLDAGGRCINIQLFNNNLTGNIPVEIGNLTNLTYMWFARNELVGDLPNETANLTNLQILNISENQIASIPNLSALTNLSYLYVKDNNLQFEDFENTGIDFSLISDCKYSPQANIPLTIVDNGASKTYSVNCNSSNNQYKWFKKSYTCKK